MTGWIDGHLDLAYLVTMGRDLTRPVADAAKECVSLPALRDAGVNVAFGTIFFDVAKGEVPRGATSSDDLDACERAGHQQIEIYERLEEGGEIAIVRSRADLDRGPETLKIIILMEGADPIRSPGHAATWHSRGVRLVGLTWALGSRYAGGNGRPGPLTPEGREMVHALDEAGIVHDLSHLSDEGVDDVLALARGSVVATHSNCRALLPNDPERTQRHLRDDVIREVGKRGGVVGLNLYSKFLAVGRRATLADAVAHVEHVAKVIGHRRGTALGSDADGGFGPAELPEGLDHPSKWDDIPKVLTERGWSEADIAGFRTGNWRQLLASVLR